MDDRVNIMDPAESYARILARDPNEFNNIEFNKGNAVLLVYSDENFGLNLPDFKELKLRVIKMAIEDMAGRAQILSNNTIGVTFVDNKLQTFLTPLGALTQGSIVYKLGIKDVLAFQKWRRDEPTSITQNDINAAIYRLVFEWSLLLK